MADGTVQDQLEEKLSPDGQKTLPADTSVGEKTAPESVSREEFDKLLAHSQTLTAALGEAGKKLAVIDRVAEMLHGTKPDAATLTKEEKLVIEELYRLIPGLKHLDDIPKVQQVVNAAAQATSDTLVTAAFGYQLELQKDAGLSIEDPKANFYIGSAIKEWINQDDTRRARFWRGDRSVVKEGFEEVKKSVIDPHRTSERKSTVEALKHRPKNAAPSGTSGVGEAPPGLDYSNPKAVREALKAALA